MPYREPELAIGGKTNLTPEAAGILKEAKKLTKRSFIRMVSELVIKYKEELKQKK